MMLKSVVVSLSLGVTDAMQLAVDSDASIHDVHNVGHLDQEVEVETTETRTKRMNNWVYKEYQEDEQFPGMSAGYKEWCINNGKTRKVKVEEGSFWIKWRGAKVGDMIEDNIECRYTNGYTQEERLKRYPDFDEYCRCESLVPAGEAACAGKKQNDACTLNTTLGDGEASRMKLSWKSVCWPGEDGGALRCAAHDLDLGSCVKAQNVYDEAGKWLRRIKVWQPAGDRCVPSTSHSGPSHWGEQWVSLSYCVPEEGALGAAGRTVCKRGYFPEIGEDAKAPNPAYKPPRDASAVATYEECKRYGDRKSVAIGSLEGCVEKANEIGLVFDTSKESKWKRFPFGCLIETDRKDKKTVLRFNSNGWTEKEDRVCGSKSNGGTWINCLCDESGR